MSTAVTINSLMRFDEECQQARDPSPFDFELPSKLVTTWKFERRPFSRTALTKVTDAFTVAICRVMVPKIFMPEIKPILHLQMQEISKINRTVGPHIKDVNIYGSTGVTGQACCCKNLCCTSNCKGPKSCIPYPEDLPNYSDTWPLYPSSRDNSDTHWIYKSCGVISMNEDWRGKALRVVLRDECGYKILPDGFTKEDLCAFDKCVVQDEYRPLFQKDKQLMFILNVIYRDCENDAVGLEQCF